MFNTILQSAGLPLAEVRLLRHQDTERETKRSPYELWRDDRKQFDLYQSIQSIRNRAKFAAPYWASFVVTPGGKTLFAGLYSATHQGLLQQDTPRPHQDGLYLAGAWDSYELSLHDYLRDLIGRLVINWGEGFRAWVQRADQQDKPILELRMQKAQNNQD